MKQELIRIHNGEKKNGLLQDIHLSIYKGELHGLILDNVMEENYLFDILQGKQTFDSGNIYLLEQKVSPEQMVDTFKKHIYIPRFSKQRSEELTIADAFFIHQSGWNRFYKNKKRLYQQIETLLQAFSVSLTAHMLLKDLSILQRIELELVKAFWQDFGMIVLKNLTALLNEADLDQTVHLIMLMKERGMAFLWIDYDDTMLMKYTDSISIISKGRTAYTFSREAFSEEKIRRVLLRERKSGLSHTTSPEASETGHEILRFDKVGTEHMTPFSFRIEKGTCLVLFDKDGCYGEEIINILQGTTHYARGSIYLNSVLYRPKNRIEAIRKGICVIDENPTLPGRNLFHNLSGLENLSIMTAEKIPHPFIKNKQEQSIQRELETIFTKEQLEMPVSSLDPLTRQKLVYYKYYLYYPHLIICVKPLSGVDIRMKTFTEGMIQQYVDRGIAVLIITSNLSEAYSFHGHILSLDDKKSENRPPWDKDKRLRK